MYINAPQEKVWEAITTPEIVAVSSAGRRSKAATSPAPASAWSPRTTASGWGDNTVLEADPPRRLVHTWRSLYDPDMAAEPESRVTWEIEPMPGGYSKLTLVHDKLDGAPVTAASVTGWSYPQQPEVPARNRHPAPPAAQRQLTRPGSPT